MQPEIWGSVIPGRAECLGKEGCEAQLQKVVGLRELELGVSLSAVLPS